MSQDTQKILDGAKEIGILQKNMRELQGQLASAQKRILELTKATNSTKEELENERQLLRELKLKYDREEAETTEAIEKQIDDWPDVLDSKPEKRFKPRKVEGYAFKKDEKWTHIDSEGNVTFEDIQPGEWD